MVLLVAAGLAIGLLLAYHRRGDRAARIGLWAFAVALGLGLLGLLFEPRGAGDRRSEPRPEPVSWFDAAREAAQTSGGEVASAGTAQNPQRAQEPQRPSRALLETVRPMGLRVVVGEVQSSTNAETGVVEWQVPVSCGPAAGEQERLASPTPEERWLFGVLWGDGVAQPRSYVQPVPKLTLWLNHRETGRSWEAAWARFDRCPIRADLLALPVWAEDASALLNGTVVADIEVEALGMPRSPEVTEVLDSGSMEDAAQRLVRLALNFDELLVPVDGLVNGGPVFEVQELVR